LGGFEVVFEFDVFAGKDDCTEHGHQEDDACDFDGHGMIVHEVVAETIKVAGYQFVWPLVWADGANGAEVCIFDGDGAVCDVQGGGAVVVADDAFVILEDACAIEDAVDLAGEIDEYGVLGELLLCGGWLWEIADASEHGGGEDGQEYEADDTCEDWFACDGVGFVDELLGC